MLNTSTAFDYDGAERARLHMFGRWMIEQINALPAAERLKLARSFTGGSYARLMDTVLVLVQPGPRLVLFEDRAFTLHALILHLLRRTGERFEGAIASNAKPFLDDVVAFVAGARSEILPRASVA